MTENKTIGQNVKYWRQNRGISRKELGKYLGISDAQVRNHEQGITPLKVNRLRKICKYLRLAESTLLRGSDE